MPQTTNRRKRNSNRPYIAFALILLALGLAAGIIALSVSGCRPSGTPDFSYDESRTVLVSSSEPEPVSEPEVSDSSEASEASSEESQQIEISLPDPKSDLPVIIEGQPASTKKFEESIEQRYLIDMNPYEQYIAPEDPLEFAFLVNSTHTLASDYVADDLVDCIHTRKDGRATQQLRLNAEMALEAFLAEGALCGVTNVTVTSAYRSYSYQKRLFNQYVDQNMSKFKTREECEKYVETFSARPGTSEHQSGLCCDMHNMGSAQQSFAKKPEAKWLAENCWRFGFILRYPADKEDITKIIFEPWHFRFVGRVAATAMHESGMCLEEYCESLGLS